MLSNHGHRIPSSQISIQDFHGLIGRKNSTCVLPSVFNKDLAASNVISKTLQFGNTPEYQVGTYV